MKETINSGGPPTSLEWHEFEARQSDQPGPPRRVRMVKGSGRPDPLPQLTPEQISGTAARLYKSLQMLVEAFDVVAWDSRWTSRLNDAHSYARKVIEEASAWQKPADVLGLMKEIVDEQGTLLPSDADGSSASSRPAGGGE